jgi:HTH-type transcriptional regulator / antitoxin HigA
MEFCGFVLLGHTDNMTRSTQKLFDMEYKVIKNEKEYQKALNRLEKIFNAKKGTKEGDELELLALLIDKYEQEKYPIDLPDPIEAIKFRMEQLGYKQKDLALAIGLKSRVSEILNRKRKLTLDMIRKLSEELSISTDILVKDY